MLLNYWLIGMDQAFGYPMKKKISPGIFRLLQVLLSLATFDFASLYLSVLLSGIGKFVGMLWIRLINLGVGVGGSFCC